MAEGPPETPDISTMLDGAPFVLVVRPNGTATHRIADNVDDAALGAYLHTIAESVRTGAHRNPDCAECAAARPHDSHVPPAGL